MVQEYPAITRLVSHRDGSYTAVFRPQLKTIRTARYHMEWKVRPGAKDTSRLRDAVERGQGSCDAIDKLQSALRARQETQGAFRTLRDTATVASMFTPAIPATIHARWELRP
jgi:hypothetical protein